MGKKENFTWTDKNLLHRDADFADVAGEIADGNKKKVQHAFLKPCPCIGKSWPGAMLASSAFIYCAPNLNKTILTVSNKIAVFEYLFFT